MANYRLKYIAFYLAILPHLRRISGLNATDKGPSDSFVVSANYGVQSDQANTNSAHNNTISKNFSPNAFQKYEGYTEHSLVPSNNYQYYPKSYLPTSQAQNEDGLESTKHSTSQSEASLEIYSHNSPQASGWRANVIPKPCSQYDEAPSQSNYVAHPYYATYGGPLQVTTTTHRPLLENIFNRNGVVDSYSSTYGNGVQNSPSSNYQAQNNHVYYGTTDNENQWSGTNSKIPNDRSLEIENNAGPTGHQHNDDSHKPSVFELQEMINKIVKGNSKVHQVLKVPAVYEIHLQEENNPSGFGLVGHQDNIDGIKPPLPPVPKRKKPVQRIKTPPRHQPSRKPHYREGTKTWNLPPKLHYFNNRNGLMEGSGSAPIYGKYAYPQPFSSTGHAKDIPLQQWYNPQRTNNRNFGKNLRTEPSVYGSVSVAMTPGTTEVTFLDYSANLGYHNKFDSTLLNSPGIMPDLNNYYAKKKENENVNFQGSYRNNYAYRRENGGVRRNSMRNYRTKLRQREERNFLPLNNLNYIIHVREKSRG